MSRADRVAVLFDLDGTLVDSAPDLLRAANRLRAARGLPPLALAGFRGQVSRGARAMLGVAFPDFPALPAPDQQALVGELLAAYAADLHADGGLFDGMAPVLDHLAARDVALGIVTNKPLSLAEALLAAMALRPRFGIVLGGDSLAERKPHPLPVLVACEALGVAPARTLFVGDDARDVAAGRAAGCRTVAVRWGYVDGEDLDAWGADAVIAEPAELPALLPW